ncbi:MAG: thioredoxin family protein [Limnochordia bacterium]|jgi:thioredoxin-like negative regulator of GroEL
MQKANGVRVSLVVAFCLSLSYLGLGSLMPFSLPAHAATPGTTAIQHLTAAQLPDWLNGKQVAFVEFYSPFCSFCVRANLILEKLAAELSINLAFIDVSLQETESLATQLGLEYIPTVITYIDGKPLPDYHVGLFTEDEYREFFKQSLTFHQK